MVTMIMMIMIMSNDETLEKGETALQMKFQDQILLQNFPADDRDDDHDDHYHDHFDDDHHDDDNEDHGNCDHQFSDDNDNDDDVQSIFGIGQDNHPSFQSLFHGT